MKRNKIVFWLVLLFFFLLGLFLTFSLFDRAKRELVLNNQTVVMNLLENHPELEGEIVDSLKNIQDVYDASVLEKYGLTSLSSLEYLPRIHDLKMTFLFVFFAYFGLFVLIVWIFFKRNERQRKKEIAKIDDYLFSLLSEQIKVDLKDFKTGDLATLQNDLMKVTSRLKNALESSTKDKMELSKTLADISHQLKTPLTSLLILNDNLSYDIDEKTKKKFLKKQEQIILHLKELIISLLKVSQIESGMIVLKKEKVSLQKILENVFDALDLLLVAKNIEIQFNSETKGMILGDATWLMEAFLNIVKNACEHSYENGKIVVSVSENPMYTEVVITDFGKGIAKQDLKHIFERFYKTSSDKESIGIGLNLTKSILTRSGATITCKSEVGKYTSFVIHFYKSIV